MKINFLVRAKNPYFWIGLLGVILTAMGVSAETFTSWTAVIEQFKLLISNPFMLGSVLLAILGVLLDPTTSGMGDSKQALSYTEPKEEVEDNAGNSN